jgi:hypothetical protein
MSHFAQINQDNVVVNVIVAEQEFIDSGSVGDASQWIQTSYNTYGGIHTLGGTPLRKNYAGIGYTYDAVLDAFIPPRSFASWTLDTETGQWVPPTPMPVEPGKRFNWNEDTLSWVEFFRVMPSQE